MRYVNIYFFLFVSTGLTVFILSVCFIKFYVVILIIFLLILWLKPIIIKCFV